MTRFIMMMTFLGAGLIIVGLLISAAPSSAAPTMQEATPIPNLSIGDDYCVSCHGQPGQTYTLEDGSSLDLYVDPLEHANSIHGSQGYACVQCHDDVGEYPHPSFSAADRRDVTLQLNRVCARCHVDQYEKTLDSVHAQAIQAGNRNAAVCSDCHTAHAVRDWVDEETRKPLPEVRTIIPQTCAQCHNEIYQTYLTSVHGTALTQENNPDVPTCIDCHGVHNIQNPTTTEFRLASPSICANCHTDAKRMAKYGISTDVLNTYVADFHGTTVAIFEKQSPDQPTNKPVCYDCHGVHDIKRADDPEKGLQVKENLLVACQKCHPDASDNFPAAWLSHYIPSPDRYPLVYYVNLFYKFFIPTVLGGMAILVVLDVSRKTLDLRKKRQLVHASADQETSEPTEEAPALMTQATPEPTPEPSPGPIHTTGDDAAVEAAPESVEQGAEAAEPTDLEASNGNIEPPADETSRDDDRGGEEVDHDER